MLKMLRSLAQAHIETSILAHCRRRPTKRNEQKATKLRFGFAKMTATSIRFEIDTQPLTFRHNLCRSLMALWLQSVCVCVYENSVGHCVSCCCCFNKTKLTSRHIQNNDDEHEENVRVFFSLHFDVSTLNLMCSFYCVRFNSPLKISRFFFFISIWNLIKLHIFSCSFWEDSADGIPTK